MWWRYGCVRRQLSENSQNLFFQELSMSQTPMTRDALPPGEVLCSYCTARCCRYFAMQIDRPETREAFDHIRWYMLHGPFSVFVDGASWYLMVPGDCQHLQADHRCGIYETRPQICRSYTTDECEYDNDGVYDQFFETAEQLWEYAQAVLPALPRRKPDQPISLPILQAS
jgi:Fe-S-cluster containining protein